MSTDLSLIYFQILNYIVLSALIHQHLKMKQKLLVTEIKTIFA